MEFDHPDYRYAPPPTANGTAIEGKAADSVQRRVTDAARQSTKPPPPASTASSADGYESFENTSNKKKRKIPLSGTSSMHQSQLSAEMASMGISGGALDGIATAEDVQLAGGTVATNQPAQTTGGGGTGISGAGRGRYGRQSGRGEHAVRRPLGSSSANAVNGYGGARLPMRHAGGAAGNHYPSFSSFVVFLHTSNTITNHVISTGTDPTGIENTNTGGIISQAIKSAAEQGPLTPQKGQEKASLLQGSVSGSAASGAGVASARTQFTFTMESESAGKMVDQRDTAAAGVGSPTPPARTAGGKGVQGTFDGRSGS